MDQRGDKFVVRTVGKDFFPVNYVVTRSIYPRALVKALTVARDLKMKLHNRVPMDRRVMPEYVQCCDESDDRNICTIFVEGKHKLDDISEFAKSKQRVMEDYYHNALNKYPLYPYDWRRHVLDGKAWIVWFLPHIAANLLRGGLPFNTVWSGGFKGGIPVAVPVIETAKRVDLFKLSGSIN